MPSSILPLPGPVSGEGLGLSISKRIVERHNGEISLESTHGSGTTFTITIPGVS